LLRASILGKKRHFIKNTNPLDPTYIMKSVSGRRMFAFGEIEHNKPKSFVRETVNKDSRRYLKNDDIIGT
jgi:hypothetical protein